MSNEDRADILSMLAGAMIVLCALSTGCQSTKNTVTVNPTFPAGGTASGAEASNTDQATRQAKSKQVAGGGYVVIVNVNGSAPKEIPINTGNGTSIGDTAVKAAGAAIGGGAGAVVGGVPGAVVGGGLGMVGAGEITK